MVVISIQEGNETVNAAPVWSGDETMTLIREPTLTSPASNDSKVYVWGLVNPTAETGTLDISNISSSRSFQSVAVNYIGTETSSVAAATNFLSEDINQDGQGGASSTSVHASGGTAGNALVLMAGAESRDSYPVSNNASFNEVYENFTGSSDTSDTVGYVADLLDGAPSAITVTWNKTDSNTSVYFEVVVESAITITSVSGDDAWTDGDTGIPIVGTGFV
jgi:hypothetical protein